MGEFQQKPLHCLYWCLTKKLNFLEKLPTNTYKTTNKKTKQNVSLKICTLKILQKI